MVRPRDETEDGSPLPSRIRPYVMTGGRTPTPEDLPPEAVVKTVATSSPRSLTSEESTVLRLGLDPMSIAELSSALALPLGVMTVVVSDLVAVGVLELHGLVRADNQELLRRLIRGVEEL